MTIEIVSGTGKGQTELAAFDSAETGMGLANSNLMTLSSVIPPGATVEKIDGPTSLAGEWGDRVYCVLADNRTSTKGDEIWAGIGWFYLKGEPKGLFAEHIGSSKESVEDQIKASLLDFMKTRDLEPDESLITMEVVGVTCKNAPVCALVAAVYQSASW